MRCMFSIPERQALRDRLLDAARRDDQVTAAAIVGSGALDHEDAWSDIDLALRVGDGHAPADVAAEWTTRIYENEGAVDHLDVWSDTTLFRVFLLDSSLQVDLSFYSSDRFAASGASFRLAFGDANGPVRHARRRPGLSSAWAGSTRCTHGRASREVDPSRRSR